MNDDNCPSNAIEFYASVAKVQTLTDGGIRVTLDLPESAIMQAAQLMECKRVGVALVMVAKPKEGIEKVVIGSA